MGVILRPGEVRDVMALCGPLSRRRQMAMIHQARISDLFAIEDEVDGRPLVAGGFLPWPDESFEEAWMLVSQRQKPRPRALVEAAATVLDQRSTGKTIVALIDVDRPHHKRFVEFLGFECVTSETQTILDRDYETMIWRP